MNYMEYLSLWKLKNLPLDASSPLGWVKLQGGGAVVTYGASLKILSQYLLKIIFLRLRLFGFNTTRKTFRSKAEQIQKVVQFFD